jgi:hypothetical protein
MTIDKDKNLVSDKYITNNAKLYLEKITALYAQGYATQGELFNAKKSTMLKETVTTINV